MKVFDINSPPKFTNNLQKNILVLKKIYGKSFIIKDGDIELPSKLYQVKEPNNPTFKFYSLVYDIKDRDNWLFPYKIAFIDFIVRGCPKDVSKSILNNNCYISNIHRTDKINGSTMVKTILNLLKVLKAQRVTLHDGASVKCEANGQDIDLSFF